MKLQSGLSVLLLTIESLKNAPVAYVDQHQSTEPDDRTTKTQSALVPWIPEEFPNPDLDQRACRTHLKRFCDPDTILSEATEVRLVEEYLRQDRTMEPQCRQKDPQEEGLMEVQMAVALVDRMDLSSAATRYINDREMHAAEKFARHVHDSWGVGVQSSCGGTGVLLFLSKSDRTVYISRGKALDPILTQCRIDRIVQQMRPFLQQEEYGRAILKGLKTIDGYIEDGPAPPTEGAGESMATAAMFAAFVGLFALTARRHRRRQRQYAEVSSHLNQMDEQRAQALQGKYKATSCPICLQDFQCTKSHPMVMKGSDGLSVKLLRCGHVFDESCWSDWVNSGQGQYDKCPICREDVKSPPQQQESSSAADPLLHHTNTNNRFDSHNNEGLPTPQTTSAGSSSSSSSSSSSTATLPVGGRPTMRLFWNERNFRLNRLGRRYPNLIREQQLRSWTSPAFTGPLARDPAFVNLDPQRNMNNSTSSSRSCSHGSSGFGGGRSSGGGGGRF